VDLFPH